MADESDFQLQNSNQAIEFSKEAVRFAGALNGGAAIAVIGFIGNKDTIPSPDLIREGLLWFGLGLVFCFCGFTAGYAAQTLFAMHNKRRQESVDVTDKHAKRAAIIGVVFTALSGLVFLIGAYLISQAVFGSPKAT